MSVASRYLDLDRYESPSLGFFSAQKTVPKLIVPTDKILPIERTADVTLVIIDMQPGFQASKNPETISAVQSQVKLALKLNWAILLLEYDPHEMGPSHNEISELVDKSSRKMLLYKSGPNGAARVMGACNDYGYPSGFFRIVGVNTDACVVVTSIGIAKRFPKAGIRLIREACNSDTVKYGPVINQEDPHEHWLEFKKRESEYPQIAISSGTIDLD